MLALIGLLGAVIRANTTNKKHTVDLALLEAKIAEIRRQGYNNALTANALNTEGYNAAATTPMELYPNFKRVTMVNINTPTTGMQTVTVTVYWDQDRRSVSKSTQLAQ
jgi:crotonobetainyl-CoA:carnitine CoA-transferase CaiB-like acyl-CoA transferase